MLDKSLTVGSEVSATCKSAWQYLYHPQEIISFGLMNNSVCRCYLAISCVNWNSCLVFGLFDKERLQHVQNAASRLICCAGRTDYPFLLPVSLHWLAVKQRITFNTVILVYKCLHGKAPSYLSELSPVMRLFVTFVELITKACVMVHAFSITVGRGVFVAGAPKLYSEGEMQGNAILLQRSKSH